MEDELTCPVCLELYADPLLLPCSHSICKKCLHEIIDNRCKKGKEGLDCPSCRKSLAITKSKVSKLPRNLALENVVFRYQEIQSQNLARNLNSCELPQDVTSPVSPCTSPVFLAEEQGSVREGGESLEHCGLCEDQSVSLAAWYCEQCCVAYCDLCLETFHPRRGSLMLHKLRRPVKDESTERGTLCVDHEKEVCSIYCDQCHILVCHLCVCEGIGKHSQHKILSLDTALEKTKVLLSSTEDKLHSVLATLTEQTSKLEENVKEIEGMHSEACKKIDQQYQRCLDDITACLAQHRQQTLDKLCTAKSVVLEQHQNHIADHSRQLEDTAALLATCGSMLARDQCRELLSRAGELPGIVGKQESTADRLQSLKQAYQDLLYDRSIHQDLKQSVEDFHTSTLDCLKALLVDDVSECQNMIPVIKTSASPGSDAVTTSSKCLTTWGFNSSTFTAEPLTRSAVWSVTVEKNTSQFGDHRAGYIFGVGISCEKVPVKEQVGMNSYSSGIICSSGNIMFSHNGKMEQLMPLDNLPLSVTVHCKVNQSKGVLLSYTITDATWGDSLHGKKILCEKFIGKPIFPVFTVSQRVKMQFPTYV